MRLLLVSNDINHHGNFKGKSHVTLCVNSKSRITLLGQITPHASQNGTEPWCTTGGLSELFEAELRNARSREIERNCFIKHGSVHLLIPNVNKREQSDAPDSFKRLKKPPNVEDDTKDIPYLYSSFLPKINI